MVVGAPRRLLATTALEESWGSEEELLFLGEWCKRYERRHVWGERSQEVVPFHWDDRAKLKRDYFYLEGLHGRLLKSIAAALNAFHETDHDVRYWQILVDPWLLSYLGVAFDRWECLRTAFEEHGPLEVLCVDLGDRMAAPFSYAEFENDTLSDEWNQEFYQRIIRHEHADRCAQRPGATSVRKSGDATDEVPGDRRSVLGATVAAIDRLLGAFISKYDVAFVGTKLGLKAQARLNLALGQVPRLFVGEFGSTLHERDLPTQPAVARDRSTLRVELASSSPFENFVLLWIAHDLPRSVVERYADLRDRARGLGVQARAVVTAGNHWGDVLAKFWFAEQVSAGAKLVIEEHGGALPPYRELFGFEEAISDAKATWFRPYHPKHRQLPAAKLVGRFNRAWAEGRRRAAPSWCAVIANECPRWVHRVQFYPMAHQWSTSFGMTLDFHTRLDASIARQVRVKPYPSDQGWNTRARFIDALGPTKVLPNVSLDDVFAEARVIVCTYPETTFAEAMASGVPTVLMYPESLYELNEIVLPLLESLRAARIVFHDAAHAAAHVNSIWERPELWWTSGAVVEVREEFRRQALGFEGDWCMEWAGMLRGLLAGSTARE